MNALVVPGVRVEAKFDVLPPLPAPSGIVGVVGIADRPPANGGLVGVTKTAEVADVLGPGTAVSMPELVHALAAGAAEVVVSHVDGGDPAKLVLENEDDAEIMTLQCRSNGAWGNQLTADIQAVRSGGNTVRVHLKLYRGGKVVESFEDLQPDPNRPNYLFDTINSGSNYIVALDKSLDGAQPAAGPITFAVDERTKEVKFKDDATSTLFSISLRTGVSHEGLQVDLQNPTTKTTSVTISQNGAPIETFTKLSLDPDSRNYLPYVLLTQSRLVTVTIQNKLANDKRLPKPTTSLAGFDGGKSPSLGDYQNAITALEEDPRINLITASIEPDRTPSDVHTIHQALRAHAVTMATNGAPRIAFGTLAKGEKDDLEKIKEHAALVRDRRFVLVAPQGAAGAVAGSVGRLSPHISPTFKPISMIGIPPASFRESELNRLLSSEINLFVVQHRDGRGVVVLRGLDTSGDQVSVTRVADVAIRETKAISENFIGRLNNEEARNALKQQIVATFLRMEREGALVPSTDGTDPAFLVDVYSTQQDFAQGIVRIDIAVRPVRAIDFIYATIRVKN